MILTSKHFFSKAKLLRIAISKVFRENNDKPFAPHALHKLYSATPYEQIRLTNDRPDRILFVSWRATVVFLQHMIIQKNLQLSLSLYNQNKKYS